MSLSPKIDAMFEAARRRLHRDIDRKCRIALGEKGETVNRSTGQLYRDRAAEAREAELRG
jgi:hypothetical protein